MWNQKCVLTAALFLSSFLIQNSAQAEVKIVNDTIVFSGTFVAPTCTPDQTTAAVELGKVPVSAFTGNNTIVATKDFTVSFSECDKDTTVNLSASGTQDINTQDAFLNTGSAGHNVAIKIKNGDTFLDAKGSNVVTTKASEDGLASFDFIAQMIQSGDNVPDTGKVTALVTLNASYE